MDMTTGKRMSFWFGSWFGRLTHQGNFILSTEIGAPFVSNLRLEWMRWFLKNPANGPMVVQLLGDIDDVVSDEDNKDLRAAAGANFYWLRVRGTGHADIVDFSDPEGRSETYAGIGAYRKAKFILAATGSQKSIEAEKEEQRFQADTTVTHIVFVLHGIRDLGKWSADFEQQLRSMYPQTVDNRLMVVSVRYGYFSMASFLFRPDRQKYVRWFMDQYTETLARYPNATTIDFIGHSNGTYLLASALEQYRSMKIRRIVFAGSVVRKDYDWQSILARGQVVALRNYVATGDAVVALFPRFFEPRVMRWLGNDVGSAGFNGFEVLPSSSFENVTIPGGHSAFRNYVPQIAAFVLSPGVQPAAGVPAAAEPGGWQKVWSQLLHFHSTYAFLFIWVVLGLLICIPGVRVAIAGGHFAWIPTVLYAALVLVILQRL